MWTCRSIVDRVFGSLQPEKDRYLDLQTASFSRTQPRIFRRGKVVIASALRAITARTIVFGILLLCLLASDAALAGRRVALVIGNSTYRYAGMLPNTLNDAKAVATLFRNAGFDVVDLRQDLGVLEFKRTIRGFMDETRTADIAVVYYAGHGIEAGGTNYVIPVDAKLATDYDAEDETVSLDRIILALQPARQLRLIILDACRDNPFIQKIQRTVSMRGITPGLGKIDDAGTGTLIAYAAKAGSVSFDGNGPNSPFTTALLKYIAEPGLDIRIALGRVRDEVLRETNNEQEPFVYGSLGGTLISLVRAAEAKKSEPQAAELDATLQRDYELSERVGTPQAWQYFLAAHGSGFYADLARAQLAKLLPPPAEKADRPKATKAPIDRDETIDKAKDQTEARLSKPSSSSATEPASSDRAVPTPSPEVEAATPTVICARELQKLNRLRASPDTEEIARFAHSLSCTSLRPQLDRLLESTGLARSEPSKIASLPEVAKDTPASPREIAGQAKETDGAACKRDEERLVKLRSNPVRQDIERFARDLRCESLRAQVARLLESISK
jgi:uncharacterized caspase-like protein